MTKMYTKDFIAPKICQPTKCQSEIPNVVGVISTQGIGSLLFRTKSEYIAFPEYTSAAVCRTYVFGNR